MFWCWRFDSTLVRFSRKVKKLGAAMCLEVGTCVVPSRFEGQKNSAKNGENCGVNPKLFEVYVDLRFHGYRLPSIFLTISVADPWIYNLEKT